MSTYDQPDDAQLADLSHAMRTWHRRLVDARVHVMLLVAFGKRNKEGEVIAPAIKLHGVRALATCKIIPIQQRVLGLGDALVTIDGDEWESLDKEERLAVYDHELQHIDLVLEMKDSVRSTKKGPVLVPEVKATVKRDDAGRPCLRIRPHDYDFGFFNDVAERQRGASQEVQQARRFARDVGQIYLADGSQRARKHSK